METVAVDTGIMDTGVMKTLGSDLESTVLLAQTEIVDVPMLLGPTTPYMTQNIWWDWCFYGFIALLLLIGIFLILKSLWPRWWFKKRPCCPKCSYDLRSHIPINLRTYRKIRHTICLFLPGRLDLRKKAALAGTQAKDLDQTALHYLDTLGPDGSIPQPIHCPECGTNILKYHHFFHPTPIPGWLRLIWICLLFFPAIYCTLIYAGYRAEFDQYRENGIRCSYQVTGIMNYLPVAASRHLPTSFQAMHLRIAYLETQTLETIDTYEHLTHLRIPYASLPESDLERLNRLNLKVLDASWCVFESSAFLNHQPQLERLNLCWSQIDSYAFLRSMKQLKVLYLDGNWMLENPSVLREQNELRELILPDVNTKDLKCFSHMTQLKRLQFRSIDTESLAGVESLTELSEFKLIYSRIEDLTPLIQCQKLEILQFVSHAPHVDIKPLARLKNLKRLILFNTSYTPEDLNYLQERMPHVDFSLSAVDANIPKDTMESSELLNDLNQSAWVPTWMEERVQILNSEMDEHSLKCGQMVGDGQNLEPHRQHYTWF